MNNVSIKAIFLDLGGVILTNGWDHRLREKVAEYYGIELEEMNARHPHFFDLFERDQISFDEYLKKVIFFRERPFSLHEIKKHIFDSAKSYEDVISYLKQIKERYSLKIIAVSNEGRDLACDRISRFNLRSFIDFFIVSSFVHLRKPDPAIYKLALDSVQLSLLEVMYIDDRKILIEAARELGLQGIWHQNLEETRSLLNAALQNNLS